MSQTPLFGFPFPVGTDKVKDGDDAIAALALQVEEQLSGTGGVVPSSPYRMQVGGATFPSAPTADTGVVVTVTFAAGRFTQIPQPLAQGSSNGYGFTTVAGPSLTQVSIRYYNPTASTPSVPVCFWAAFQMNPSTAPGLEGIGRALLGGERLFTVTCDTDGCANAGIPIPIAYEAMEGEPAIPYVVCGVCERPVTKVTAA